MSLKLPLSRLAGLLALILSGTASAAGVQAGDWLVRGGATGVFPTNQSNSDQIVLVDGTPTGTELEVKNGYAVGLTGAYMITNNWAVELLLAAPYFKHDIDGDGGVLDDENIGEIEMLPPSLNGQYHFNLGDSWKPYLGAGLTYFWVLDETNKLPGALGDLNLDVDSTLGANAQVGIDYIFSNNWLINADLRYMWIETDAKINGLTQEIDDIKVNPVVMSLQVGYKF